ncbi:hypothetical protein BDQ94DRAFT_164086 [Aspergillus welwitschiae]|uniref:Uncharacterized protein n=1 Tax=Aspergillus welwitschiae TaxID=1341132 RepID=A0A3F3PIX0_9EURO|nr:hypothetical protein BDQ94DRAFT_164086 [Aspergillus welwitschiae]RDH26890.1 hypothetical protein BDQ94DRAFT_164086 [Aspergillus welwitschiae]
MLLLAAYAVAVLSKAAFGTQLSIYERRTKSSVTERVCGVVESDTDYTSLTVSFSKNGTNMTYSWSTGVTSDCVTFLDGALEPCKGPSPLYCEYLDFSFKPPSSGVASTQYSDQPRSSSVDGWGPESSTVGLGTTRSSIEIISRQTLRTSTLSQAPITGSAQKSPSAQSGTMRATSTAASPVSSTSTGSTLCVVKESDLDKGVCYCLDQTTVPYSSSECSVFGD